MSCTATWAKKTIDIDYLGFVDIRFLKIHLCVR